MSTGILERAGSAARRAALGMTLVTLGLWAGVAQASFVGGTTQVTLDAGFVDTVTGAGLAVAPRGTATLGGAPLVASFPITGNTPATQLFHDGSGLRFGNAGGTFLNLDDFVIDLAVNQLTGTVDANGTALGAGIPLFAIGADLGLTLTGTAAGAIASVFGLGAAAGEALTGLRVGTAAVTPAVPEPGTLALALLAVGALLLARQRRAPAARAALA